jgi:DNA-binding NtrC family response regulator
MPELSVVVIAQDSEQRALLQVLVDGTSVARVVHTCTSYPVVVTDPVLRRVQSASPQVVLVDVPGDNHTLALRAIELIHQEVRDTIIFAVGSMAQPQVIVSAMRSGAREYIERPTTTTDLLEAFVRLTAAQRKVEREGPRGKVFTVVNAKGGSGATTTAVNLALALHAAHGARCPASEPQTTVHGSGFNPQSSSARQLVARKFHDPARWRIAAAGWGHHSAAGRTSHRGIRSPV